MKATTKEAYELIHKGAIALSKVEAAGLHIDVPYLKEQISIADKRIRELENELRDDAIYKAWKRAFGSKTNLGSRDQLGKVIFGVLGLGRSDVSEKTNRFKADASALDSVDSPFVKKYIYTEKLKKVRSTYLSGILRNITDDGLLHTFFNLHTTRTFRSSSSDPNFQNIPIRDPEMGKIIRRAFVAPKDYYIGEADFGGIEVRIAACYNKDPRLIDYICDETKDMHRDMAAQCYKIDPSLVTKAARYAGKNMFVFPQFYGDYFINCARNMWEAIDRMDLEIDGVPMKKHLKRQGIRRLGECDPKQRPATDSFEFHMKQVEKDFWGRRFKVYAKWKDSWYDSYLRTGQFTMKTGFTVRGLYSRNDVVNYPIQGSAFHCLLWCLIELVKELKKRKMKTYVAGQIHDSILAYIHKDEVDDYLALVSDIMTRRLPKAWKWIIVPLVIEAELSPLGGNWFDKKQVKI